MTFVSGDWSVAAHSELFDWQVRYLDIYRFYVYTNRLLDFGSLESLY